MASPQTEHGYTKTANELLEKLALFQFNGLRDLQLILFVIRKTYGYGKKTDRIALSQIVSGTGIDHSSVCRILKRLAADKVLVREAGQIGIQKDWQKWKVVARTPVAATPLARKPLAPTPVAQESTGSGVEVNKTVAPTPPTKERKKITKEISARASPDAEPEALDPPKDPTAHQQIIELFDVFRTSVNPTIQFGHKTNRAAAETLIKKYGAAEAVKVAQYAVSVQGEKYAPVITTPHELLMKLGQLGVYAKRERGKKPKVTIIS